MADKVASTAQANAICHFGCGDAKFKQNVVPKWKGAVLGVPLCGKCFRLMNRELNSKDTPLQTELVSVDSIQVRTSRVMRTGPCFFGHVHSSAQSYAGGQLWYAMPSGKKWNGAKGNDTLCYACWMRFRRSDDFHQLATEDLNTLSITDGNPSQNFDGSYAWAAHSEPNDKRRKIQQVNEGQPLSGNVSHNQEVPNSLNPPQLSDSKSWQPGLVPLSVKTGVTIGDDVMFPVSQEFSCDHHISANAFSTDAHIFHESDFPIPSSCVSVSRDPDKASLCDPPPLLSFPMPIVPSGDEGMSLLPSAHIVITSVSDEVQPPNIPRNLKPDVSNVTSCFSEFDDFFKAAPSSSIYSTKACQHNSDSRKIDSFHVKRKRLLSAPLHVKVDNNFHAKRRRLFSTPMAFICRTQPHGRPPDGLGLS